MRVILLAASRRFCPMARRACVLASPKRRLIVPKHGATRNPRFAISLSKRFPEGRRDRLRTAFDQGAERGTVGRPRVNLVDKALYPSMEVDPFFTHRACGAAASVAFSFRPCARHAALHQRIAKPAGGRLVRNRSLQGEATKQHEIQPHLQRALPVRGAQPVNRKGIVAPRPQDRQPVNPVRNVVRPDPGRCFPQRQTHQTLPQNLPKQYHVQKTERKRASQLGTGLLSFSILNACLVHKATPDIKMRPGQFFLHLSSTRHQFQVTGKQSPALAE